MVFWMNNWKDKGIIVKKVWIEIERKEEWEDQNGTPDMETGQ